MESATHRLGGKRRSFALSPWMLTLMHCPHVSQGRNRPPVLATACRGVVCCEGVKLGDPGFPNQVASCSATRSIVHIHNFAAVLYKMPPTRKTVFAQETPLNGNLQLYQVQSKSTLPKSPAASPNLPLALLLYISRRTTHNHVHPHRVPIIEPVPIPTDINDGLPRCGRS